MKLVKTDRCWSSSMDDACSLRAFTLNEKRTERITLPPASHFIDKLISPTFSLRFYTVLSLRTQLGRSHNWSTWCWDRTEAPWTQMVKMASGYAGTTCWRIWHLLVVHRWNCWLWLLQSHQARVARVDCRWGPEKWNVCFHWHFPLRLDIFLWRLGNQFTMVEYSRSASSRTPATFLKNSFQVAFE